MGPNCALVVEEGGGVTFSFRGEVPFTMCSVSMVTTVTRALIRTQGVLTHGIGVTGVLVQAFVDVLLITIAAVVSATPFTITLSTPKALFTLVVGVTVPLSFITRGVSGATIGLGP